MRFSLINSRNFLAAFLTGLVPLGIRKILSFLVSLMVIFSFGFLVYSRLESYLIISPDKLLGIFLLGISIKIFLFMVWAFIADFELQSHKTDYDFQKQIQKNAADVLSFPAFNLFFKAIRFKNFQSADSFDLLSVFFKHQFLKIIFFRAGITEKDFDDFLRGYKKEEAVNLSEIVDESIQTAESGKRGAVSLSDIILAVFEKDSQFKDFLFKFKIRKSELESILLWISRIFEEERLNKAWWNKDNLLRVRPIAGDWAYGRAYIFNKYAVNLTPQGLALEKHSHLFGKEDSIADLERILSRNSQPNAILVGEPGVGKKQILFGLARNILLGKVSEKLQSKQLFEFNWQMFIADFQAKEDFEMRLFNILNEVSKAGNIILVMDNFPEFIESTERKLGIGVEKFFEPYISGSKMQLIAISDKDAFKETISRSSSLVKFFEIIYIKEPEGGVVEKILEDTSLHLETNSKSVITYFAIKEIIRASQRYLTKGVMPERAIDILEELFAWKDNSANGGGFILAEDVLEIVKLKTGIPVGELKEEEKDIFSNLEERLHKRVINQEEAIQYLANALKRSRADIQNPTRPIGSFLFLGPTGVGKTETAKALSAVYFGGEDKIIRLDMSEYRNEDALSRIIGFTETNIVGSLSEAVNENPYSLLLLDEFEKAHNKVGNLFLQILEEGFFSDAFGKRVNMRNSIIIATSNAASDLIWRLTKENTDPALFKDKVIDAVLKEGFFKPELLNRFDGVVVFHPLSLENLKKVANLLLVNLKRQLQEKDIELVINNDLIEMTVNWGYDSKFGARPMRRAIQDRIENTIAGRILKGELVRGSKVEFSRKELEEM